MGRHDLRRFVALRRLAGARLAGFRLATTLLFFAGVDLARRPTAALAERRLGAVLAALLCLLRLLLDVPSSSSEVLSSSVADESDVVRRLEEGEGLGSRRLLPGLVPPLVLELADGGGDVSGPLPSRSSSSSPNS